MTQNFYERYSRQELIKGWVQKNISDSRITVVGHNYLSEFVNLGLAALGVGEIRILTNKRDNKEGNGILSKLRKYVDYKGNEKAKILAHVLKRINPSINVIDIHSEMFNRDYFVLINNSRIVIDTTNNQTSKSLCQQYCKEQKIPFISASVGEQYGLVDVDPDDAKIEEQLAIGGQESNLIISEVLAGFVIDEARKILLPLNQNEKSCKKTLRYNLMDVNRF